ncbi:MAG: sigma 54-interacting transcriptional regulator [Desulfovibrio sp.]|jgi:PAS domain S-box-containing protein|nr:sigma 54-interacting transcriptional regulator [Desulfovibrio sp.]
MPGMNKGIHRIAPALPDNVCAGICSGPDWVLEEANEALAAVLARSGDGGLAGRGRQPCGKSFLRLLSPGGQDAAADGIRRSKPENTLCVRAYDRDFAFSWTWISPDGQRRARSARPDDRRFFLLQELSVCLDYREMQAILDSMYDGIWVIDGNGITRHVNRALKRIAGIEPREMIGNHVAELVRQGRFSSAVTLNALQEKKVVTRFDDYPGGVRCLNTSTPIFDEAGKIWRVVACIRDMTELERLQKRLADAERVAHKYKSELVSLRQNQNPGFVAGSEKMLACLRELEKAARAPSGILLLGETGTGKTLASGYIHRKSQRARGPFVSVNCAAISSSLIESELFGYEKGAFTGASQNGKKGFFELADQGTLLLDEIGELPLAMQAKLLQVLDDHSFHRVGGEKRVNVDVRVIAATNRPLEQMVGAGEFRADLYYRLRVLSVSIPPLREHPSDIPALAMTFLNDACQRYGTARAFSPKALECLSLYSWPGNVRELRAAVELLTAMTESNIIRVKDLPSYLLGAKTDVHVFAEDAPARHDADVSGTLREAVASLERSMIRAALSAAGSTYKAAARLGISQSSVVRKARKLGIGVPE